MTAPVPPKKADFPFYLLLLPVFFLLHGVVEHPHLVRPADAVPLLPRFWLPIVVGTVLLWYRWRNWQRAALMVFAAAGIYFYFGIFHDGLKAIGGQGFLGKYSLVLPLLAAALLLLFRALHRSRASFVRLTRYLNVLLVVLLLVDTGIGTVHHLNRNDGPLLPPLAMTALPDSAAKPDIHLIVADGYAGDRALAQYFGFDNSAFTGALTQRGFRVVPDASSNYNYTAFSMASLLNMDFLPLPDNRHRTEMGHELCFPLIRRSRFAGWLQHNGYEVHNHSIFALGDAPPPFKIPFFRSGRSVLLLPTLESRLNRDLRFHLVTRFHLPSEIRRLARYEVNQGNGEMADLTLAESRRSARQPRFIYTHLMLPHDPYFYRKDGTPVPAALLADPHNKDPRQYLEYLQYANGRLLSLVDSILAGSPRPPIILLLSDHSYRGGGSAPAVPPHLQLSVLNAVYLPSGNYSAWYPGISHVNHLRALLNQQFHQRLPMLRDSSAFLVE
ncbi:hypothetical protein [Flaviaesturariibacter amylovorans]|uniref:Sulfatase N-terminal domain-containing protein n=1 Tax=Flaviaesturariibacter amylovorans TaxID=1084520 RepID=A0ABP8H1H0_9BACT